MSKQKLIYISGKMGEKVLSEATVKKFEMAQDKLVSEGWAVINPASPVFQRGKGGGVREAAAAAGD